jgi:Fe-S-cluster containining protein
MDIEEQAFEFLPRVKEVFKNIPEEVQIEAANRFIDGIFEKNDIVAQVQCGKQECSFCCHDQIMLSTQEAEYIKKNATYEINQELLEKQRNALDFKKLSFADRACIFLKEGKCSIYEYRPLICKSHNVKKGTNPNNCIVTDGLTKKPNEQAYSVPVQSMLYYFAMKDFPELKSTFDHDFLKN